MILRYFACKKGSLGSSVQAKCKTAAFTSKLSPTQDIKGQITSHDGQWHDREFNAFSRSIVSVSEAKRHKRDQDRDFLISVLESSATKRDAKAYLQTFGPPEAVFHSKGSNSEQRVGQTADRLAASNPAINSLSTQVIERAPHLAVVKLKTPELWDSATLHGVAKTVVQLKYLGLTSIVVLDCDVKELKCMSYLDRRKSILKQSSRVLSAIRVYEGPGAVLIDALFSRKTQGKGPASQIASCDLAVKYGDALRTSLLSNQVAIVLPFALNESDVKGDHEGLADADDVLFALVDFFNGLQSPGEEPSDISRHHHMGTGERAHVDRVIIIDPIGGIPSRNQGHGANVFINLEDEFEVIEHELERQTHTLGQISKSREWGDTTQRHVANLTLAKKTLSILPSTSSAVILSPTEVANLDSLRPELRTGELSTLTGEVGTRRKHNPLIHNLLTDRPVYSSSLPIGRVKSVKTDATVGYRMPTTTLVKRGLPVTIFPDPHLTPWAPPRPGSPRLRLTDSCIDLPRLIHLINDSFNRELDVEAYLERVNDSLAGIIIAGEYDGGAILTWERPHGMDEKTADRTNRLVPYLDKFAVLKKSQGAGGVSDIVFNAMVRNCFPDGVCWRSRRDNPVNKWYFERSRGTKTLSDSNWAMFWTTPGAHMEDHTLKDYEAVCRGVVPTWKDSKPVLD